VFSITNRITCHEKGEPMALACQPVYLIAHQLVAGLSMTPGANWERAIFRNGVHRWVAANFFAPLSPGVVVERLVDFDECVRIGNVVAFTHWDPSKPDVVGPTLALARLAALRHGFTHEGQTYSIQHWQTLNVLGGPRG
jgi:hypothetical protein